MDRLSWWRKGLYILSWIPVLLVVLTGLLLGLILVPIALQFKEWPKVLWLWGNDEDDPRVDKRMDWYRARAASKWWMRYWPNWWWYCIRNPFNNFRFLFDDTKPFTRLGSYTGKYLNGPSLREIGRYKGFRWNFRGWMASYEYVRVLDSGHTREFWIGWKVGATVPGLGFSTQFKWRTEA